MNLKFNCVVCQQKIDADEFYFGKEIQCPACQKKIVVPNVVVTKQKNVTKYKKTKICIFIIILIATLQELGHQAMVKQYDAETKQMEIAAKNNKSIDYDKNEYLLNGVNWTFDGNFIVYRFTLSNQSKQPINKVWVEFVLYNNNRNVLYKTLRFLDITKKPNIPIRPNSYSELTFLIEKQKSFPLEFVERVSVSLKRVE
jgi:hypothetical protein